MNSKRMSSRSKWALGLSLLLPPLLALVWLLLSGDRSGVKIPYSEFMRQVRLGNVAQVYIQGSHISGKFLTPVPWRVIPLPDTANLEEELTAPPEKTYGDFHTFYPEAIGDPELMPELDAHDVLVEVSAESGSWLPFIFIYGLPLLITAAIILQIGRQRRQSQTGVLDFMHSKARRYYPVKKEKVTFDNVAGADEAKQNLHQVVDFLRYPGKYHDIGARIPLGVLLVGPPGTGKTLLARAVAGEAGVPFFHISGSEFVEMYVGVGASRVRDLFKRAREAAPAIIFIDELDAVGRRRGIGPGSTNDEREQTLNQLLVEMDGFEKRQDVIIMAATNRPDILDPALLRPGRFDRQITVGVPDRKGREEILAIHTRGLHLAEDVDLVLMARSTTGMSGADLANLCNEAALIAARDNEHAITKKHFEEALDKVLLGEVRSLILDEKQQRLIAYHECGHALVAWLLPHADPVHKVTIVPRGQALGITQQVPGEDQYNYSREYLKARLAVTLAGRAAEDVALGDVTTGAENDLREASRLARRMVTRWGMGGLGPISLEGGEEGMFFGYDSGPSRSYSEDMAGRVDRAVESLLTKHEEVATNILRENRAALDSLVEAILRNETIGPETLQDVLGPRPMLPELRKPA